MTNSLAHLEKLIAYPTISRDSNLDLMAYVRGVLEGCGISSLLVHNEDGRKANLWATMGPEGLPGVVLSGHTDVVPVEGQAWSSDPFRMERRGGNLYGRGTADMKGSSPAASAWRNAPQRRNSPHPFTSPSPMTRRSAAWVCVACWTS